MVMSFHLVPHLPRLVIPKVQIFIIILEIKIENESKQGRMAKNKTEELFPVDSMYIWRLGVLASRDASVEYTA